MTAYPFTSQTGFSSEAEQCNTPIEFFKLFFTPEVNNIIHVETLQYAAQRMPTERYLEEHPNARAKDWKKRPMTLKEVDVLLSTILIIGIIGYPRIRLVITTI